MIEPAEMDAMFKTYGERAIAWAERRGMGEMVAQMHLHPDIADGVFKLLVLAWMEGAAAEHAAAVEAEANRPRILVMH